MYKITFIFYFAYSARVYCFPKIFFQNKMFTAPTTHFFHIKSSVWGLYPLNILDYNPHNDICQGGDIMIIFNNLWKIMEEKGISTYVLREKCGIDSKTIRRLKANENIETKTLNKLCAVLDCRLEDIAEFIKD
jgi:DNA-binding Xre family transcriptional regulator